MTRCRPNADMPFFCDVRNRIAANHVDNGVRIRWKIVPTVTDGQEFDEDSSHTINPVTGVLTIHWADGRASPYSPGTWQRIEDQPTPTSRSGA